LIGGNRRGKNPAHDRARVGIKMKRRTLPTAEQWGGWCTNATVRKAERLNQMKGVTQKLEHAKKKGVNTAV